MDHSVFANDGMDVIDDSPPFATKGPFGGGVGETADHGSNARGSPGITHMGPQGARP